MSWTVVLTLVILDLPFLLVLHQIVSGRTRGSLRCFFGPPKPDSADRSEAGLALAPLRARSGSSLGIREKMEGQHNSADVVGRNRAAAPENNATGCRDPGSG